VSCGVNNGEKFCLCIIYFVSCCMINQTTLIIIQSTCVFLVLAIGLTKLVNYYLKHYILIKSSYTLMMLTSFKANIVCAVQ
jgi:hypothetical protein